MLLLIYLFCVFICIIPASNSSLGNCWLGNWWLLQIWDWDWSVSPYGQFNHLWQQWQCCRNLLVCHTPVLPQPGYWLIHPYPLLLCVYGFCHFYALKLSMKLAWTWIQSITRWWNWDTNLELLAPNSGGHNHHSPFHCLIMGNRTQ